MTSSLLLSAAALLFVQDPAPPVDAPFVAPEGGARVAALQPRIVTPSCERELRRADASGPAADRQAFAVRLERAFDVRVNGCPAPVVVRYLDPRQTGVDNNLAQPRITPPQPRGWADE